MQSSASLTTLEEQIVTRHAALLVIRYAERFCLS